MNAIFNIRFFAAVFFAAFILAGCGKAALYAPDAVLSAVPGGAEARARQMVGDALAFAEKHGHDEAIRHINEGVFSRGQFYVFVLDAVENRTLANPNNPEIVGTTAEEREIAGVDRQATQRKVIAGATSNGAWVRYRWKNPQDGEVQNKKTWAVRTGDYIYGCGFYEKQ
jgi:signal transduction histidine kinase